jgi:Fic/DOC family
LTVVEYLSLADFLLVAEVATGVPAEDLSRLPTLGLAESALAAPGAFFGGVEFYPDFVDKAAVLCTRIVRNHPLPDGNKRSQLICLCAPVARQCAPLKGGLERIRAEAAGQKLYGASLVAKLVCASWTVMAPGGVEPPHADSKSAALSTELRGPAGTGYRR